MKKITALILIIILALILVPAQASVKATVTEKSVWLRDNYGTIIDEIPVGTQITVESYNSSRDMFSVSYGSKSGYIKGTGLSVSTSSLKSQLSSQKSNNNGKVSLNAQAAYNLAQKSNADSVKKNGCYVTCESSYKKNGAFHMQYITVTSTYSSVSWNLDFYDKTTAYEIKPDFSLMYIIVSSKPSSVSVSVGGRTSITLPASSWEYFSTGMGVTISFAENLNLLRDLVKNGGTIYINFNYNTYSTKIDVSKYTQLYQGLKTVFAVWEEAGLDNIYSNTTKVTAPPTTKPTATPKPTAKSELSIIPAATAPDADFTIGKYVTFGTYPQTAAGTDATPIEWLILDVQDDNVLLISKYALDTQPYNNDYKNTTWEKCGLRTWLNDAFLNKAFTIDEQQQILTTQIDNSQSQGDEGNETSGGNNTQDKVFLLSYAEATKYFDSRNKLMCIATDYAIKSGSIDSTTYKVNNQGTCQWWLRSPGYYQYQAKCVYSAGSLASKNSNNNNTSVRPTIWISSSGVSSITTNQKQQQSTPVISATVSPYSVSVVKSGSTISFGHYEQDNKASNGKEPIEWKVLAVDGNKALIISTYGLDTLAYGSIESSMKEGLSWKTSELRTWLNSSFYNAAFDQSEKSRIISMQVTTNDAYGKFTTNDNVFALSMTETKKYFSSSSAMACTATEYAKTKLTMRNMDGTTVKDDKYATWWLRDLVSTYKLNGFDSSFNIVALVWANNGINTDTNAGWPFIGNAMVVRPAMWIELDEGKPVSVATPAPTPTPKAEGFDLSILKACPYYTYDKFAKEWNAQAYYDKNFSDARLTVYLLLFDSYVEEKIGPELRVCFYDKKNSCYCPVSAFRVAVGETIYRFEGMITIDDNNVVFACNTLMELCKNIGGGQELAFQLDYTDNTGKSKTITIDPLNNEDMKDFINLANLFNHSNVWSVVKNLNTSDTLYNASID